MIMKALQLERERERTLASGVEEGRNIGPNGVITGGNTWRTGLDGGCCGFVGAIQGRHSFEAHVTVPTRIE